jgi:hypothetical protein
MTDHLVKEIEDAEQQTEAFRQICTHYQSLLLDDDEHPVYFDANGVLRFKPDPLLCQHAANGILDLDRLAMDTELGHVPEDMHRKILKQLGYSLNAFFNSKHVAAWDGRISALSKKEREAINRKRKTE